MVVPAEWSWELAVNGATVAELTTATGRNLQFQRNTFGRAGCAIFHEDDTASLLMDALKRGLPTLKCWRRTQFERTSTLRFHGWLAAIDESLEETGLITLDFRGPFGRLVGEGSERGRFTPNYLACEDKDVGAAANELVRLYGGRSDYAVGGTDPVFGATYSESSYVGLDIGTTEAISTRSLEYRYANVGETITGESAKLDGFDFEERYVDEYPTLAYFDVMREQGSEQLSARFEHGAQTINNVRSVQRTTEGPINTVRLTGAYGIEVTVEDATSVAKYGRHLHHGSRSDIYTEAELTQAAYGLLRPEWVRTIQFTPEPTLAPSPWDDYWLGDRVPFYARRGSFGQDTMLRVNQITVAIDDNGHEVAEIPDPLDPEGEAAIYASMAGEVV